MYNHTPVKACHEKAMNNCINKLFLDFSNNSYIPQQILPMEQHFPYKHLNTLIFLCVFHLHDQVL